MNKLPNVFVLIVYLFILSSVGFVLLLKDPDTSVCVVEKNSFEVGNLIFEIPTVKVDYVFPLHPEDFRWDGVNGDITSPFGERDLEEIGGVGEGFHKGLDMWGISHVGVWQARVVAVADGVILGHWFDHPVKGKCIEILHSDGSISEYSHLSKSYIHERRVLSDGSMIPWEVKQGDVIGRIGNTSPLYENRGMKTHLHFALRKLDPETGELGYVNPLKFINIPLP